MDAPAGLAVPPIVATPRDSYCLIAGNDCTATEKALAADPAKIVLTRPTLDGLAPTSDKIVQAVVANTNEVRRVDKITPRLTSWGRVVDERLAAEISDGTRRLTIAPPRATAVWVVVVEGEVRPQFARSDVGYPWAMFVVDAATGSHFSMIANVGPLPPYVSKILSETQ